MKIQILENRQLLSGIVDEIESIGSDIEVVAHDVKLVFEGLEELHRLGVPKDLVEIFAKTVRQAITDVENGTAKTTEEAFTRLVESEMAALKKNPSVEAALWDLLKNRKDLEASLAPLKPYLDIVMTTIEANYHSSEPSHSSSAHAEL